MRENVGSIDRAVRFVAGPSLMALALTRWGALAGRPSGLFMLVWGGFLSTADNFVRPALISHQTPVSTLLVFLGVIGGRAAFGFIGFIAGPVILVLATQLLRFAEPSRDSAR